MYYRLGLSYAPKSLKLAPAERGFSVTRTYEPVDDDEDVWRDDEGTWHVKAGARVRVTLRMVGKSLFGRSMGDQELEQIGDTISTIQAFIVRQIVQPYKMPWFRISGQSEKHQQLRREADQIVLKHIQARREEGTGESDFLKLLLEAPYHDTGKPMTEEQALIESLQLMVAGNETSSNALTWVFYLLARHRETLVQVREEVQAVVGQGEITYESLQKLALSRRVLDEALRLYPPFWMIDRIALQDDEICGIHVPAGTLVVPYIYGTHRNTEIWDNPEAFDPSRFEPSKRKGRPALGYIPFGAGPRVCIGKSMAVMQMLLIVASFVRSYDFSLATDKPVGIRPMMLLRPDGPIKMQFRPC
jgi:cytochrome P450